MQTETDTAYRQVYGSARRETKVLFAGPVKFCMKRLFTCVLLFCAAVLSMESCHAQPSYSPEDMKLREEIAQMLLVGFRGTAVTEDSHIYRDIVDYKIGGVILFEYDAPSGRRPRNITSRTQLKKLTSDLQKLSSETLFISIDQEGGMVSRLRPKYGFPRFASAKEMARTDSTSYWGKLTARTLSSVGINLNFAPCVDVDVNSECPVIGKLKRSFSDNPDSVAIHAEAWIRSHRNMKILTSLKHFPGHGSSQDDTHLGIADVTETWTDKELTPYRKLIRDGNVDMIMTSHVFNAKLDSLYPASLSKIITTGMLRKGLNYDGVIITDDLVMGAIANEYELDEVLELAILAGADILCLSNNGHDYDPDVVPTAVDIIYDKVKTGVIPRERIHESYERIMKLKRFVSR